MKTAFELSETLTHRYRPVALLGQGGMGRVYLCECDRGRVAIKAMRLDCPAAGLEQFRQEARLLATLKHPHLVKVREYVEEDEHGFLVMEYLQGQTLESWVRQHGPAPVSRVLGWAAQLCSVLQYLHGQRPAVLFRDLKPSNVMVDSQDHLKLIDFGIAREQRSGAITATFLQGLGSSGYAPLEQYQGAGGTDPRSDLYGLGATLYFALTGVAPTNPVERVTNGSRVKPLRQLNPLVPLWLEQVILRLLALRKDERYADALEAEQALRGLLQSPSDGSDLVTEALPMLAPRSSTDNFVLGLAGILTTVALSVLGWLAGAQQVSPLPGRPVIVVRPQIVAVESPTIQAHLAAPVLQAQPAPASEGTPPKPVKARAAARLLATPPERSPQLPEPDYPVRTPVFKPDAAKPTDILNESEVAPTLVAVPPEALPELPPAPTPSTADPTPAEAPTPISMPPVKIANEPSPQPVGQGYPGLEQGPVAQGQPMGPGPAIRGRSGCGIR